MAKSGPSSKPARTIIIKLVERTPIPFRQILDNITAAARIRPLVIQALFMRINGEPPPAAEQAAFCDRLNEITAAGGKLKLVQIYTVARRPAESFVTPLTNAEVDALVELVRRRTGLAASGLLWALRRGRNRRRTQITQLIK